MRQTKRNTFPLGERQKNLEGGLAPSSLRQTKCNKTVRQSKCNSRFKRVAFTLSFHQKRKKSKIIKKPIDKSGMMVYNFSCR